MMGKINKQDAVKDEKNARKRERCKLILSDDERRKVSKIWEKTMMMRKVNKEDANKDDENKEKR